MFYQVKNAYCEYYYPGKTIELTRQNIALLKGIEAAARARLKTGRAMQRHVIKIQVELGKLADQLASLEDKKEPFVARLNAAMNRPLDTEIPIPLEIDQSTLTVSDSELVARLKEKNPRLKAMASKVEAAERGMDLAHKRYKPNFSFGATFMETGESVMPASDSGKDPIALMATLNIPLWRSSLDAGARASEHSVRASRQQLTQLSNTLEAQLEMVLFQIRDADRRISLFRDTLIPKAEESMRSTQTAYMAGEMTGLIDLLDAERMLLAFQLNYHRARTTREQRLAEAQMLTGTL